MWLILARALKPSKSPAILIRSRPSLLWCGRWESKRSSARERSRWRVRCNSALRSSISAWPAKRASQERMKMKVFYDRDADLSVLRPHKIAVLGFGSQGHAHALNLRDSGMDVRVGLRKGSPSWEKAAKQGLRVLDTAEAAREADVIMVLVPDEMASDI